MSRHTIELHDDKGQPAEVQLDIRTDTVELHCTGRSRSITSRLFLSMWLEDPFGRFEFDDATWNDTNPVTLTIAGLTGQLDDETLTPIRADLADAA